MAYVDLADIFDPAPDASPPAEWGDQIRDNFEALVDPPRARVSASANQAIPDNADTALSFDTIAHDSHGLFDPGTPTRLTVPAGWDGLYVMQASIAWGASSVGRRRLRLRLNGTTVIDGIEGPPTGSGGTTQTLFTEFELAAGDYIEFVVNQTTGGLLDSIGAPPGFPNFSLRWAARTAV